MTADGAADGPARARPRRLLEPWFAPFGLINGAAVGLAPILLPVVAVRYGVGHVGLVMGAFNLGAFAAPLTGGLADRYHAYRVLAIVCAAVSAVSLWLFPLAAAGFRPAGFRPAGFRPAGFRPAGFRPARTGPARSGRSRPAGIPRPVDPAGPAESRARSPLITGSASQCPHRTGQTGP